MSDRIGIGSVVRLKTGGPEMTIVDNGDGNEWCSQRSLFRWVCSWFEGDALRRETFPAGALERIR